MIRDADGWPETREKLRAVVDEQGASSVADQIPCGRATLFRLLNRGTTPAITTQRCVEEFLDDVDLVRMRRERDR